MWWEYCNSFVVSRTDEKTTGKSKPINCKFQNPNWAWNHFESWLEQSFIDSRLLIIDAVLHMLAPRLWKAALSILRYHYSFLSTLPALKTPKPWQHSKEPIEKLGQDVLAQVAKGLRTLPEFSDALQEENVHLFAILLGFSAWNRKKGNCTDYSAKQHIILPSLV